MTQYIEIKPDGEMVGLFDLDGSIDPLMPEPGDPANTIVPNPSPLAGWPACATPTTKAHFRNGVVSTIETSPIEDLRTALMAYIDKRHDQIVTDRIGAKAHEYEEAYADACAFRDSGWADPVPGTVSDYAEVKGWTNQDAAQDVIDTGTPWNNASRNLRKTRLARKEDVRRATDPAQLPPIRAAWDAYEAQMRAALGI